MEEITEEAAELVARVAALDIGKASLVACVRVPHESKPGRRRQEVRTFATTTRSLLELRDWLICQGVSLCVMEATSDLLEAAVLPARRRHRVLGGQRPRREERPGPAEDRPAGCGLAVQAGRAGDAAAVVRAAAVAAGAAGPVPLPAHPVQERTREKQRAEKLLEDTQIKLSAVISDIFGKSGRDMLEALIAGQRDPTCWPGLARGSMRTKKSVLQEALTGHFRDHHGYLLRDDARPRRCADRPDRGADRADRGGDRHFRAPGGPAG